MQTPNVTHAAAAAASSAAAAAADRPPDRYVVRPTGVLADLLGAADLGEDELLLRLRELELITYPSPLLEGLLEKVPEVLAAEVLARLEFTDLVLFGQAGRACRAAVVAFVWGGSLGEGDSEVWRRKVRRRRWGLEEEDEEEAVEEEEQVEEEEAVEEVDAMEEAEEVASLVHEESLKEPLFLKFRVDRFVGSVERLAWAKARGTRTCAPTLPGVGTWRC